VGSRAPPGHRGGSPDGHGRFGGAPTAAVAQTGADTLVARLLEIVHVRTHLGTAGASVPPTAEVGLTEIAVFTGDAALPPRTGTMVTMRSRPLSGTSVPAAGGLPSPRPTTSSGPR
jgi:hypothetical protein